MTWVVYGLIDPRNDELFLVEYDEEEYVDSLRGNPVIEEGEPGSDRVWEILADGGTVGLVEFCRCESEALARDVVELREVERMIGVEVSA